MRVGYALGVAGLAGVLAVGSRTSACDTHAIVGLQLSLGARSGPVGQGVVPDGRRIPAVRDVSLCPTGRAARNAQHCLDKSGKEGDAHVVRRRCSPEAAETVVPTVP
jgi:hypothetical protein